MIDFNSFGLVLEKIVYIRVQLKVTQTNFGMFFSKSVNMNIINVRPFTALFFKIFILKLKSKSIFPTRPYVQVGKMDFDFDFKINR